MALLSQGSAPITVAMFHSVFSTEAQRAMLTAAADTSLSGPELDAYKDLMEDFSPRYRERNKLIHNLWGHSDDHPEKALWCKASDAASVFVAIANNPNLVPPTSELSLKCMAYTVQDINDVVVRLEGYRIRVMQFIIQLVENHPQLAAATTAATSAPPIGEEAQLGLQPPDQTDPQSDRSAD
jgi:hypothetical protein